MHPLRLATAFVLAFASLPPALAIAQPANTNPPISNPAAGPSLTPAPVPSVPPGTPATGAPTIPPEQIAPPDKGAAATDAGPPNASPFSGAPTALIPGTGRDTTEHAPAGASPVPPLSR